jgi:PAS domain S-box-containing protein
LEKESQKLTAGSVINSESYFQLIQDSVPAMMFYIDQEQRYRFYNGVFKDWFKVDDTEAIGKSVRGFIGEKAYAAVLPHLTKAYGGTTTRFQVLAPAKLGQDKWLDIVYTPHFNADREVMGVIVHATDVTQLKATEISLRISELRFRSLVEEAPVATCLFTGRELTIALANERMLKVWGKDGSVIGLGLLDALPELKGQPFLEILDNVYTTGEAFHDNAAEAQLVVGGALQTFYFNYTYKPLLDEKGDVYGIMNMAVDVTEQVLLQHELKESESRFRAMLEQAPVAMLMLRGDNLVLEMANEAMLEMMGRDASVIGKPMLEFMPELEGQEVLDIMRRVYRTGVPHHIYDSPVTLVKNGKVHEGYYSVSYVPVKENNKTTGVLEVALDVTERYHTQQQLENSRNELLASFNDAPVAIALIGADPDLTFRIANPMYAALVGRPQEAILNKPLFVALPEIKGQGFDDILREVLATGKPFISNEHPADIVLDGKSKRLILNFTYQPMRDERGIITGILAVLIDVTEQVVSRQKIESKEKELRDLITASPIGICVVSGSPVMVEEVNDRFELISGKTREQFMGAPYWTVLEEAAPFFEHILDQVFATGVKFTTGETEVALLRNGITENVYLTFEYIPVKDTSDRVTKVIVMAVEVTHQVEIRRAIEAAVTARTKELAELNITLKRSNEELEQFAYIASHDLQEPVRKISTFSLLLEQSLPDLPEKSKMYFQKIYNSTDRMVKLIRDVLAYSQVYREEEGFVKVDLNDVFTTLENDFELQISQTKATLAVSTLPVISGVPSQLTQLFGNLLSNSLKYIKPGVDPVITISVKTATAGKVALRSSLVQDREYHHITFSDNGIGFEQQHADTIFKIFQRLHAKDQFAGTGIGLSIVRKIVQQHSGHISAEPGKNGGAVFNILLPFAED